MDIEEIVKRLEDGLIVADRIQQRHAAALESHKEWLEDLTRVATEHQQRMADHDRSMADHDRRMADHDRSMEDHRLRMEAIDERLEQIGIKLDRIAELIFRDRSSNGHES